MTHFNNLLKILNKNRIFSFKLWGTISMGLHLVKTGSKQKPLMPIRPEGFLIYN
jgi:hypothetical protein